MNEEKIKSDAYHIFRLEEGQVGRVLMDDIIKRALEQGKQIQKQSEIEFLKELDNKCCDGNEFCIRIRNKIKELEKCQI